MNPIAPAASWGRSVLRVQRLRWQHACLRLLRLGLGSFQLRPYPSNRIGLRFNRRMLAADAPQSRFPEVLRQTAHCVGRHVHEVCRTRQVRVMFWCNAVRLEARDRVPILERRLWPR